MESQDEIQERQRKKISELEHALKMANLKIEGYEIMNEILREDYGIDLSKN